MKNKISCDCLKNNQVCTNEHNGHSQDNPVDQMLLNHNLSHRIDWDFAEELKKSLQAKKHIRD